MTFLVRPYPSLLLTGLLVAAACAPMSDQVFYYNHVDSGPQPPYPFIEIVGQVGEKQQGSAALLYGDLLAPVGAEVVAPEHGKILSVEPDPWLRSGRLVFLEAYTRTEAHFVRYYNLTDVQVAEDEYVGAGQVIGRIGAVRRIIRAHFNRARKAPFIEFPDEIGLLRVTVSAGPSNTDGLLWPPRDPIPYFRSKVSGRATCADPSRVALPAKKGGYAYNRFFKAEAGLLDEARFLFPVTCSDTDPGSLIPSWLLPAGE